MATEPIRLKKRVILLQTHLYGRTDTTFISISICTHSDRMLGAHRLLLIIVVLTCCQSIDANWFDDLVSGAHSLIDRGATYVRSDVAPRLSSTVDDVRDQLRDPDTWQEAKAWVKQVVVPAIKESAQSLIDKGTNYVREDVAPRLSSTINDVRDQLRDPETWREAKAWVKQVAVPAIKDTVQDTNDWLQVCNFRQVLSRPSLHICIIYVCWLQADGRVGRGSTPSRQGGLFEEKGR